LAAPAAVNRIRDVLKNVLAALGALDRKSALVGGFAVSVHAEPRFTRDVGLAVSVPDDAAAEQLVRQLQERGYRPLDVFEQTATRRLATVRLAPPGEPDAGVLVDLHFAFSGIEPEIVEAAGRIRVFEGMEAAVIRRGHLIALKIFARDDDRRPMDRADLVALIRGSSPRDLEEAREALRLITERGYSRGKNLIHELEALTPKPL
jgi:hypothetical protein